MISKYIKIISRLPLYLRWAFAYNGRISEEDQLRRLKKLRAPDGPKQIIMVQIANTLWLMGRRTEAIHQYSLAKKSELEYNKRRNNNVHEYIIQYCSYCSYLIQLELNKNCDAEIIHSQAKLKSLPVPDSIVYQLPLPFVD